MGIVITEIEIGFENVEVANIPPKYVVELKVWGMRDFRLMHRRDDEFGIFLRAKNAEKIIIIIDRAAREHVLTSEDNELFERIINYSDITSVNLKYSDGAEENIYADWEDATKGGENNLLQRVSFDNEGNLVIKIGKLEEE